MASEITFTKIALPYGWLGNMAPYRVWYERKEWRTTEALFQALRFDVMDPIREGIRLQKSPMAAKMAAKKNRARMVVKPMSPEDLTTMGLVLLMKVEQHPELKEKLLDTGDAPLIEDTTARANESGLFWGAARQTDGSWKGTNHLGKIWMGLRERLFKI